MAFDEWMTDPIWIELIRKCMHSIDYDPCSNLVAQKYVKATEFCILDSAANYPENCYIDGLQQRWFTKDRKNVFVNPPYSRNNVDQFVDKAIHELDSYSALDDQMIMLVNSATDCFWYHKLLARSSATLFIRGRIKFWKIMDGKAHAKWEGVMSKEKGLNKIGNSPRYLNTLFYFGTNIGRFNEVFNSRGIVMVKA